LGPETGLDPHCVAEFAVQLAKYSSMTVGELARPALQRGGQPLVRQFVWSEGCLYWHEASGEEHSVLVC
jgi:hypothetical protein